jgi:hypothetical protein
MIQEEIWLTMADRPSRAISTSTIIFELLEPGGVVAWAHGAEVGVLGQGVVGHTVLMAQTDSFRQT